jgi:hypothetical protein
MCENRKPWIYKAMDTIHKDFDDIENLLFQDMFLIPYAVNNGSNYPFLEFGLKKKPELGKLAETSQLLTFPFTIGTNKEQIFEFGKKVMDFLLEGKISFENTTQREILFSESDEYEFKGYKQYEDSLYVFVDVSKWKKNDVISMEKNSVLWFVLVDEIKNTNNTSLLKWENNVEQFFSNHPEFLLLHDEDGKEYKDPEVVYIPNTSSKLKFTAIFGPQQEEEYFRDYSEALEEGKKRYKKEDVWWGIVKFAVIPSFENQLFSKNITLEGLSFHIVDKKKLEEKHDNYIL